MVVPKWDTPDLVDKLAVPIFHILSYVIDL